MEAISILIIVGIVIIALFLLLYGIGFTSIGADEVGIVVRESGSIPLMVLLSPNEAGYSHRVLRTVHFKVPLDKVKSPISNHTTRSNSICICKIWRKPKGWSNFRRSCTKQ
jgi:uncharacterized membrane protein YqiK